MYTGVYWANDAPVHANGTVKSVFWGQTELDTTSVWNNMSAVESPSYCVRLLVFEMPTD